MSLRGYMMTLKAKAFVVGYYVLISIIFLPPAIFFYQIGAIEFARLIFWGSLLYYLLPMLREED